MTIIDGYAYAHAFSKWDSGMRKVFTEQYVDSLMESYTMKDDLHRNIGFSFEWDGRTYARLNLNRDDENSESVYYYEEHPI